MKQRLFMTLLSASALLWAAGASLSKTLPSNPIYEHRSFARVIAQQGEAENAPVLIAQADFDRDAPDARPPVGMHPPIMRRGAPDLPLDLAASLAAAETYVGITSIQLDAWRAYTSALITFAVQQKPDRKLEESSRERPDRPPSANGLSPLSAGTSLLAEHLADIAIERGEQAKTLKALFTALRMVLDPEQVTRLREAESNFLLLSAPSGPEWPGNVNPGPSPSLAH